MPQVTDFAARIFRICYDAEFKKEGVSAPAARITQGAAAITRTRNRRCISCMKCNEYRNATHGAHLRPERENPIVKYQRSIGEAERRRNHIYGNARIDRISGRIITGSLAVMVAVFVVAAFLG